MCLERNMSIDLKPKPLTPHRMAPISGSGENASSHVNTIHRKILHGPKYLTPCELYRAVQEGDAGSLVSTV